MRSLADLAGSREITSRDVLVVGEFTTESGPYADDYFVVVVLRTGNVVEVPTDAADEIHAELERLTGTALAVGLANRTDFASRVLYPPALRDHPLYEFTPAPRAAGLLHRLADRVLPLRRSVFTKEVAAYVESIRAAEESGGS
jgi:hypothetical protein